MLQQACVVAHLCWKELVFASWRKLVCRLHVRPSCMLQAGQWPRQVGASTNHSKIYVCSYTAPEAYPTAERCAQLSCSADMYAFGVILHELAYGQMPCLAAGDHTEDSTTQDAQGCVA